MIWFYPLPVGATVACADLPLGACAAILTMFLTPWLLYWLGSSVIGAINRYLNHQEYERQMAEYHAKWQTPEGQKELMRHVTCWDAFLQERYEDK